MPGDPKKPTAAARKAAAKAKQGTRDQVLAEKSPTPRKRDTNKSNLLGRKREAVIKEGKKQRTDRQTYRSEKESTLTKTKRISAARADRLKKRFDKNVAKKDRVENAASRGFDDTKPTKKGSVRRAKSADVKKEGDEATLTRSRTKRVVKSISRDKAMKLKRKLKKAKEGMKYSAGGKNPVVPPKPGDPGYDERDFRATDKYKKKLKKRSKKTKKAATAKTSIGKKFKSAAARYAHRRVLDFKGKKYEYKPRKYKPKSDTTFAAGGKFPDLTGDGKVTKADILKGRGVIAKHGMKYAKHGMKHPTEDKYTTSDGRTLSKSAARESAIKSIRKTAAKKASRAHKQGDKKGKKIVGYRKAPGS